MGGVNRALLVGTIGKYGVEVRYSASGAPCASFTLALVEMGMAGLEKALRTWDPAAGSPFTCTVSSVSTSPFRMRSAPTTSGAIPPPSAERWKPPAEYVRPAPAHESSLYANAGSHAVVVSAQPGGASPRLSPTARQALDDFLADFSLEAIASRDAIPYERARGARRLLFATLRPPHRP